MERPRLDYDRVRDRGLARRDEEEALQWIAYCFTKNDNGRVTNAYLYRYRWLVPLRALSSARTSEPSNLFDPNVT